LPSTGGSLHAFDAARRSANAQKIVCSSAVAHLPDNPMRKFVILIMLVTTLGYTRQVVAEPSAPVRVGVVLPGTSLFYWRVLLRGIRRAAENLHVDLLIRSPSDGNSIGTQRNIQLKMLNYAVSSGAAGILLAAEPLDGVPTPVVLPVPVVLLDRSTRDYQAISTVSTDNFAAGRAAAASLVPVLGKHARVAILRLAPDISATTERENGFESVARERGWNVAIDAYVGFRPRDAEARIAQVLSGYDGHLDAVFAPAEPVAYGALRVIRSMPEKTRPRLVVFDWRPEFQDALRSGLIHADILQDPYRMGYLALQALVGDLNGRAPSSSTFVRIMTLTRENMDSPAGQEMLGHFSD
jgi:ribose transport system substrate-binding protein